MKLDEVLRNIRTGPQGPSVGAFFDFDGTIVHGFARWWSRLRPGKGPLPVRALLAGMSADHSDVQAEFIRRSAAEVWCGRRTDEFTRLGHRLFTRYIAGNLYPEAWALIREHRDAGHTVVIATAVARFQVDFAAKELDVVGVLCTELSTIDGMSNGEIDGVVLSGRHKADAISVFARDNDIRLEHSYGYSSRVGDVAFLSAVGSPRVVNPGRELSNVARQQDWQLMRFRRRGRPGVYRIARTVMALLALLCGVGAALAVSVGQYRSAAVNRMYAWVPRLALRGAGIRVRVTGIEHAQAPRPAVFLFNHQSQVDTLLIPWVLRTAFVGVVTGKARRYPIFGWLLRFVGVTFVDRSAPGGALRSLDPLVPALKSGISVAIAPEGQVAPTPRLLPFKKGAFHLALEAGVPIVPIVIRNSWEVLWRSSVFVHPGVVDIVVLEPISIVECDLTTLDDQVERVRQTYIDTLHHWPELELSKRASDG